MSRLVLFILLLSSVSCQRDLVFPVEPYIEYRDLQFRSGGLYGTYNPDTVKLSFYVRDGDFDLGLEPYSYLSEPYNKTFYFLKSTSERIADFRLENGEFETTDLIRYRDKKKLSPDTLPSFAAPDNCTHWRLDSGAFDLDTVYFEANPNYYNIDISIYTIDQNDVSSLYDFSSLFSYPNCYTSGFNGIFPQLGFLQLGFFPQPPGLPFTYKRISQEEGIITYNMRSSAWSYYFGTKKIKFSVRIRDRALHVSNTIETPEISIP